MTVAAMLVALTVLTAVAGCTKVAEAPASSSVRDGAGRDWAELEVVGHDYAFRGPDSVPPGETVITFRNAGSVRHELKLVGLRPGASLGTVVPLAMIDSGWSSYREPTSGILIADPGRTTPGRLLVNLEAGRTYLLVCAFADTETAPLHSELGMIRVLHVRELP